MITTYIQEFRKIVGADFVFIDQENLQKYSTDCTENIFILPSIVIKPRTAQEISQILYYCNKYKIPVTPRGAGTGLSGGAIPTENGVVLSLERFNEILYIDEKNLQVTTEPGVITEFLQDAVKAKGLFYPPDPSSRGSCFIGGNVAENSGGPKAVKYGVVKDYVLNLEVVLPTGEIIWTGANVLKNVTGYNLTQLMVGSEGTLGIIVKIVLKLIPLPKFDLLLLASFKNVFQAAEAVSAIFRAGVTPSALELMESEAIKISSQFLEIKTIACGNDIEAQLIIEVDGQNQDMLYQEMEIISSVLEKHEAVEILFAEDTVQKAELWKMRRRVAEIVKQSGYTIEEDTVVPRYRLPELIQIVKDLGKKHNFKAVCYGHAGDGNLHIRINHPTIKNSYQNETMEAILYEMFQLVYNLGGTISGEHGIGLIQKKYMNIVCQPIHLELYRNIKKVFDPNHILNSGKGF